MKMVYLDHFFFLVLCFWAVTLARALELGHKPSVVLALATETSKTFTEACMCVCSQGFADVDASVL